MEFLRKRVLVKRQTINGQGNELVTTELNVQHPLVIKALELGGSCEGPPGVRGEEGPDAFYGAYFRDLDGNKLAAFCIGPAD